MPGGWGAALVAALVGVLEMLSEWDIACEGS